MVLCGVVVWRWWCVGGYGSDGLGDVMMKLPVRGFDDSMKKEP